jgi:hypothetical protein
VNVGYADIIATDHTARHDTKRLRGQVPRASLAPKIYAINYRPRPIARFRGIVGAERQENTKDE